MALCERQHHDKPQLPDLSEPARQPNSNAEEEFNGTDLSVHKITAIPERGSGW
jgi:hypothetical protein